MKKDRKQLQAEIHSLRDKYGKVYAEMGDLRLQNQNLERKKTEIARIVGLMECELVEDGHSGLRGCPKCTLKRLLHPGE